ncbi:ATP-dependent Clp protease adaptor ClpS [Helicobacter winghamensis]|uniref:ATP-dependent Clp protease adapter protein ClpS n=1 Tax=Helicobacter winghamensis TaxID=157268 RepID=A0A2N3PJQ8_9HELI|nr:ATP-dependent Clp protease adaptor ClpS [Helicobacter winghamensis]EEO26259.1 ATP-dependent Clp protease adaptor protein ClpS [Helicobacter winghamensis ATCC BAA-430]PKT77251.1 ATP-dependent Clp protease adaptor ClpS [Helicobacter winghamensis]PKT77451.1 ATP-dependent Clp protease adaptor ClpS [Helicobacter winghamensis]PKT77816.1 ATP-dependent Clp protease adaptor ClpS [Helicobacter winghamensis]PKT81417.1 ATP-dependent Clp protease adaptor ClpS [Helicobacter winghamensis]
MPKDAQFDQITETLEKIQEPIRYRVILLNDDYTTQEFVIEVLQAIFHKDFEESLNLMLQIHHNGKGVCGIYPYDIAEIKVAQVRKMAKEKQYPLRAILEKI